MEDLTLVLNEKECNKLAYEIFMRVSGIDREGRKYERMKEAALEMRDRLNDNIKIQARYRYYKDVELEEKTARIGNQIFNCPAFEQIDPETIRGAYIYAISAGDFSFPDEKITTQVFADIWGTAFTDAVRMSLKSYLQEKEILSDSFGPGFYGMDVREMAKIAALIDFSELGVELKEDRIMVPLKSCAGLYFAVNEGYREINNSCKECRGIYSSCNLCQINGGRQDV